MSASGDSSLPRSTSGAADAPHEACARDGAQPAGDVEGAPGDKDSFSTEWHEARAAAQADLARARASLEHLEALMASLPDEPAHADDVPSAEATDADAPASPEVDETAGFDAEPPAPVRETPLYTLGEEIANSITHGIGVLLAIAGLVLLIVKAVQGGAAPTHVASAIVFGVDAHPGVPGLHPLPRHRRRRRAKRVFRVIDHSSIYLLIAGSYTPFCLITLADVGGIPLFVVVWALAFAGISFEIIGRQRQPRWVTILIYLAMGWLVVFRLPELIAALDPVALALLAVGGLCYTIGTLFYLMKKIRYMHSVWHLWVLAGSIFIYMAVILYVI